MWTLTPVAGAPPSTPTFTLLGPPGGAWTVRRTPAAAPDPRTLLLPLVLTVSGTHASLTLSENGGLVVRDLGSSVGTWVNGARAAAHSDVQLAPGDVVVFGHLGKGGGKQQAGSASMTNSVSSAGGEEPAPAFTTSRTQLAFLASGASGALAKALRASVKAVGGALLDAWPEGAGGPPPTALLVIGPPSPGAKLVRAVLAGVPVVASGWLEAAVGVAGKGDPTTPLPPFASWVPPPSSGGGDDAAAVLAGADLSATPGGRRGLFAGVTLAADASLLADAAEAEGLAVLRLGGPGAEAAVVAAAAAAAGVAAAGGVWGVPGLVVAPNSASPAVSALVQRLREAGWAVVPEALLMRVLVKSLTPAAVLGKAGGVSRTATTQARGDAGSAGGGGGGVGVGVKRERTDEAPSSLYAPVLEAKPSKPIPAPPKVPLPPPPAARKPKPKARLDEEDSDVNTEEEEEAGGPAPSGTPPPSPPRGVPLPAGEWTSTRAIGEAVGARLLPPAPELAKSGGKGAGGAALDADFTDAVVSWADRYYGEGGGGGSGGAGGKRFVKTPPVLFIPVAKAAAAGKPGGVSDLLSSRVGGDAAAAVAAEDEGEAVEAAEDAAFGLSAWGLGSGMGVGKPKATARGPTASDVALGLAPAAPAARPKPRGSAVVLSDEEGEGEEAPRPPLRDVSVSGSVVRRATQAAVAAPPAAARGAGGAQGAPPFPPPPPPPPPPQQRGVSVSVRRR